MKIKKLIFLPILTFTEIVRKFLNWNEKSGGVIWLKRICGVLIIVAVICLL